MMTPLKTNKYFQKTSKKW